MNSTVCYAPVVILNNTDEKFPECITIRGAGLFNTQEDALQGVIDTLEEVADAYEDCTGIWATLKDFDFEVARQLCETVEQLQERIDLHHNKQYDCFAAKWPNWHGRMVTFKLNPIRRA
jgi:hypothetical protein